MQSHETENTNTEVRANFPGISTSDPEGNQGNNEVRANFPAFPVGYVEACPQCEGQSLRGATDLEFPLPKVGQVVVACNLSGVRCRSCGYAALDANGFDRLLNLERRILIANYETKVTNNGRMLSTYLRGDLARVLSLEGGTRLEWTPLDRDNVLVRIHRDPLEAQ